MATDPSLERLRQIKHIVVLMMENRSFDHMLGYLTRDGMPDLNGLSGAEFNLDDQGNKITVYPFPPDETSFHPPGKPYDESLDPCHGPRCVAEQLADGNGGFVRNYITQKHPPHDLRGIPMGHYTAAHLPVYDFLARQFCVCDAWHSSIPGDTWPNRLYALAACTAPSVGHKLAPLTRLLHFLDHSRLWHKIENAPIYEVAAFTRQLDDSQWRWYSHDPATLRAADKRYRNFRQLDQSNFAYFNRKEIVLAQRLLEAAIVLHDSFFDDAAKGELREVSWVDPNFIDVRVFDTASNDDHPPSDITAGQQLVFQLYDALSKTTGWQDTLLVVTYDEHGGFYDHVPPPPASDGSGYPTFGVRVPALVIGPRVKRFVCHDFFDHTSLMKTILLRFTHDPQAAIARMGERVLAANHLGLCLQDEPRTDIPSHDQLQHTLEQWRTLAHAQRMAAGPGEHSIAPDGAGQDWQPTELQQEFAAFVLAMRENGLPPGQP